MPLNDPDTVTILEGFGALLGLEGEARARELERLRRDQPILARELETLLASDAAGGSLLTVASGEPRPVSAGDGWLPAGTRVGPYEIRSPIGRGGMGTVYLAERVEDFRRPVALKLIRPGAAGRPVARFHAERQILATLDHPGIVRLLDGGTDAQGSPYLVMEFIAGLRLDHHCEALGLPRDERVGLVHQVAVAVAYAQERDILHRDIKPSNIVVGADGVPKVTDFGLARLAGPEGGTTNDHGSLIGTIGYMAPERVAGGPGRNGPGGDVYALGMVLYRLIAGRLPFESKPPARWMVRALSEDPPPPGKFADIPRDLGTIAMRAIAREPAERFATAADLAEQLRRYLAGEPLTIRPPSPLERLGKWSRRHRKGLAAWGASFAAALVAMLGLLAYWNRGLSRDRDALWRMMTGLSRSAVRLVEDAPPGDPASFRFFDEMVRSFDAVLEDAQVAHGPSVARQAALMHRHLATSLFQLGRFAEADLHLDRSVELLRPLPARFADREVHIWVRFDILRSLKMRSLVRDRLGEVPRALADADEALGVIAGIIRDQPGEPAWIEAQASLHGERSVLLVALGRGEEAMKDAALAVELADRALSAGPDDLVRLNTAIATRSRLASFLSGRGRFEEGEVLCRDALKLAGRVELLGIDHWSARALRCQALEQLSSFLLARGRHADARPLLVEAVRINREMLARTPGSSILNESQGRLERTLQACDDLAGTASAGPR